MKGYVSNIQRYSVTDGYGIRTIVFLLGCPLRCKWCQNPESLRKELSFMFDPSVCRGCGVCGEVCPHGTGGTHPSAECTMCCLCSDNCAFEALKPTGRLMDDEDVLSQVMLDEVFFRESGGGMTLSGGEPLAQADFSALLMRRTKERGIHNCVETAGFAPRSELEKLIPYTDLFLYDIKLIDRSRHMYWTGVPNEIIMGNLIAICDAGREAIVRTPLIPGVNDGDEFVKIVDYVAGLAHVAEFHILPFHQLGASKYGHMGWEYEMSEVEEIGDEVVERAREYAESQGLRVSVGGYGFRFREEMR